MTGNGKIFAIIMFIFTIRVHNTFNGNEQLSGNDNSINWQFIEAVIKQFFAWRFCPTKIKNVQRIVNFGQKMSNNYFKLD